MNDLWNIAACMAEELEDIADAGRQAGYPLTKIERLLAKFEDYALKHAPTDGCPMCFAEELVVPMPISPQRHGNTNIMQSLRHLAAEKEESGMASTLAVKSWRLRAAEAMRMLLDEAATARREGRSADADAAERMRAVLMAGRSLLVEENGEIRNDDDR